MRVVRGDIDIEALAQKTLSRRFPGIQVTLTSVEADSVGLLLICPAFSTLELFARLDVLFPMLRTEPKLADIPFALEPITEEELGLQAA